MPYLLEHLRKEMFGYSVVTITDVPQDKDYLSAGGTKVEMIAHIQFFFYSEFTLGLSWKTRMITS